MKMLEEADKEREKEQAAINKRADLLSLHLATGSATVHDYTQALCILGDMIDASENGDAVREDMFESSIVQRPLLQLHAKITREYHAISKALAKAREEGL